MGILSLNLLPPPSPYFFELSLPSPFNISQAIEYRLSVTPEPYESAPTPEDISLKEIKAWAAVEEDYVEAVANHTAWKEAKAVAEREEKSRLGCEAQAVKVEALKQKAEEKRRAEEKRKEEEWKAEER
ncbi:hypothetical protein EDD85DRAFT_945813 [Armillaria nabsnona]|nr:hypothetical protein EDD85DRAFT_945813 [Armillaria nabsnona]